MDMATLLAHLHADWDALVQVLLIDIALAGDNAIVVGIAVAGLPAAQKRRAIFWGIAGATVLRIALGAVTSSCWRSSAFCWPAVCCCSGCAGRCFAN